MSDPVKVQVNRSSFKQSGWRNLASGETHIYFNEDQPPQDGSYQKVWEQLVEEIRTVTRIELE